MQKLKQVGDNKPAEPKPLIKKKSKTRIVNQSSSLLISDSVWNARQGISSFEGGSRSPFIEISSTGASKVRWSSIVTNQNWFENWSIN